MKIVNLFGGTAMAVAVSLLGAASASATTITFDGLTNFTKVPDGYNGLNWSSNFYVLDAVSYTTSGYTNGLVSPRNVALNWFEQDISFSSASGGAFTLTSLYLNAAWNDGLTVAVTGKRFGSTLFSTNLLVSTAGPDLHLFNWSGIDEVDFSSINGGGVNHGYSGAGHHVAIDNIVVNGLGVPEPATWTMMLLGFGALGLTARARRSRAIA